MSEQDIDDGEVGDEAESPADAEDGVETDAVDDESGAESSPTFENWLACALDADVETADADGELVEYVSATDDDTLAAELAALRSLVEDSEARLEARRAEVDDLQSRLARKQADFQNYKKRQQERLEDEKARATEDLVERLLDVRDNLARALDQDEGSDIRGGVESTLRQLDREFEREDVEAIEPEPGEPTDPAQHEVLMRVESDQPEDTVADVHRPGYEMAGKVLRPAQVTVSEGAAANGSENGSSSEGA